jgi:porphobilinogen deaminase
MATVNLKDIPDELRNQFKAACALRGQTIRDVLMELMQKEVEKGRPKK